jgi:small subunit ribosomal protein S8
VISLMSRQTHKDGSDGALCVRTSSGLLTDKQAGKKGVGGEVLAYVW